jgi:16S rRNA (uracil1498-N3)-methyltransferase
VSAPVFISPEVTDAVVGSVIALTGAEARHAGTVQRRAVGERIDLVDGHGRRASTRILSIQESRVDVEVEALSTDADPAVTLVQALAKGGRDEQAVESAVELGVTAVIPWAAERSIVQWRGPKADKALAQWRSLCVAAAKQSRRAHIPEVNSLVTTRELMRQVEGAVASGARVLVLHEEATVALTTLEWQAADQPVWLVVGPEGGISGGELAAFGEAGAEAVRLGPHVLRASSAGPAAISALAAVRGTWR